MSELVMWTIYDHPRDFPNCFVARKQRIRGNGIEHTAEVVQSDSLGKLRARFRRMGLVAIARHPNDDPVVVECWI